MLSTKIRAMVHHIWFYVVLESEPKPSCKLGKQFTNWATPLALCYIFCVLKIYLCPVGRYSGSLRGESHSVTLSYLGSRLWDQHRGADLV